MHLKRRFPAGLAAVSTAVLLSAASALSAQTTQPATQPATQPDDRPAPTTAPDLKERDRKPTLGEQIADAHNEDAWDEHEAIGFRMSMMFGESLRMVADITYDYHGNRVRMELMDGPTLVFDGEKAWVSPAEAQFPRARFHLLTWPYFLAAPFKLDDPGTKLEELGVRAQRDKPHYAAKLTFEDGVGDAPDDWYILYANPAGYQLREMAYIVTYGGTTAEEAEKQCHAITYDKFGIFNGVVLATQWEFYNWNEQQGIHGEALGHATISRIQFVEPADELFARPADAREDALPGGEAPDQE